MSISDEELHKKLAQEWQQKKDDYDERLKLTEPGSAYDKLLAESEAWEKSKPKPPSFTPVPTTTPSGAITMTSSSQNQNTAQSTNPPGLDAQAIAVKLKITNPKITTDGNTLTLGERDNIKVFQNPRKTECTGPMSDADITQAVQAFILQNVNVTDHILKKGAVTKDGIPTAPFNPPFTPAFKSDGSEASKALEQRFLAKFNELTAAAVLDSTATNPATPTTPTPAPPEPTPAPPTLS